MSCADCPYDCLALVPGLWDLPCKDAGVTPLTLANLALLPRWPSRSSSVSLAFSDSDSASSASSVPSPVRAPAKLAPPKLAPSKPAPRKTKPAPPMADIEDVVPSKRRLLNPKLYKTEMCRTYSKNKRCPYGQRCQFAHGANELKDVMRAPNYRTKQCVNWARSLSCPYGDRCCFRHE